MGRFKAPLGYPLLTSGSNSRFAGMPAGVELRTDYYVFDPFTLISDTTVPNATAATPGLDWTTTPVNASTITASDDVPVPRVLMTTAAAENDGVQAQYTAASGSGEFFDLITGKLRYFGCRFALADANDDISTVLQNDVFMGMAITDTTVLGGATDFIGFSKVDGSGVINFVAGKNASTSGLLVDQIVRPTGITLTADDAGSGVVATSHSFEFVAFGTNTVAVYADGIHRFTVGSTTQLPDDENLCPTMAFLTGEAVAKVLHLYKFVAAVEF